MVDVINSLFRISEKAVVRLYDYSRISYLIALRQSKGRPNAVFIWIPKSAGTSVWLALEAPKLKTPYLVNYRFTNRGIVTFGHMNYSQLVSNGFVNSSFDDTAFKFAIVRNPYDRAVSLYSYLQTVTKGISADKTFLDFCRHIEAVGCPPIGLYNTLGLSQCNPQTRWVENISMDYIGKVESIESHVKVISSRLGLRTNHISHANKSRRSPIGDYYCSESRQIVQEFYKEDFLTFGYSQELPTG